MHDSSLRTRPSGYAILAVAGVALMLLGTPLALPQLSARGQGQPPTPVETPRDQRPTEALAVGTGAVTGTVTVADSGQPARKARVSLSGVELRGGRSVITDANGSFAFAALPAGRYSLSASKPGHVTVSYGQRRPGPGRPGTPIQLGDGQKLQVALQLPRGGVITGAVLDENGEAVPGTPVRALRYVMQSGQRVLQSGGAGSTDDRGIYRIFGLQPGEYIVAATPRNSGPSMDLERATVELAEMRARLDETARTGRGGGAQDRVLMERIAALRTQAAHSDEPTPGYAPVYYPGTTQPASAATVAVNAAEEKMGVDFQLQLVPVARVEGVVVNSNGPAPRNVQVSLLSAGQAVPGVGTSSTRADANGRFRFSNIAPGQYILVARGTLAEGRGGGRIDAPTPAAAARAEAVAQASAARLWAMLEVGVDGRNLENLVLTLQPGMTITGRLNFEGTSPVPADLTRIRVSAVPVDMAGPAREIASPAPGRVDANGRFTLAGVVPGRYRITASGGQGWTLASSTISGQDTLDFPLEMKPSQNLSGVTVTFTDKQAEVTGTIVNDSGQPAADYTIILYAAEREFWTPGSRRIFSQRPGTDGRFTFRNMPAGDYRIAPVLDPEPGTWFDPAFLQQLDTNALRVPIGPGEKKVQNLRIQ
jgi:protocatechuate 3,4-dioxygenase beta subunit